jgi:hypothetical protein
VRAAKLVLLGVGVVDIVGRIGPGQIGELAIERVLDIGKDGGVAAQQAVVAQTPEIARTRDRLLGKLRYLAQPQMLRRLEAAMAGEDAVGLVDQDRVGPAELDHRRRDLRHLIIAVRARVPVVRTQPLDRPQLQPIGERCQAGG